MEGKSRGEPRLAARQEDRPRVRARRADGGDQLVAYAAVRYGELVRIEHRQRQAVRRVFGAVQRAMGVGIVSARKLPARSTGINGGHATARKLYEDQRRPIRVRLARGGDTGHLGDMVREDDDDGPEGSREVSIAEMKAIEEATVSGKSTNLVTFRVRHQSCARYCW